MNESTQTRAELIAELAELRARVGELETASTIPSTRFEALQESEGRLRALTAATRSYIYEVDLDGIITFANRTADPAVTVDDVVGSHMSDWFPEDLKPTVLGALARVLATGELQSNEYTIPLPSGGINSYISELLPFKTDGEITGAVVTATDITERTGAERALRESESRLSDAQRIGKIGSFRLDVATGYWTGTNWLFHILGIEEMREHSVEEWAAMIHPDHRESLSSYQRSILARKIPFDRSYRIVRKSDGEVRWVHSLGELEFDESGDVVAMLGTTQDITEHKRAEHEQARLQQQLSNALDMAHLSHWEYDVIRDVFLFNDAFYRLFRTTADQVGGYSMSAREYARRFVHPDDLAVTLGELTAAVKSAERGSSHQLEHRTRYLDGEVGHLAVRFSVEKNTRGEAVKAFGVSQDITKRKQDENDRATLEEQLRQSQKMEAIGRLAGGVAHDFNNLLTGIVGYASLIRRSLGSSDPMLEDIGEIMSAADRAATLTRQLLAFSRKQVIAPRVVEANEVILNSKNMLARIIGEDIDISFTPGSDLWHIRADPSQLDQVLVNLATNAREVMPNGGRLSIQTANVVLDAAYCKKNPDSTPGEYVILSVRDDGRGMSRDVLQRIFEPFFTTGESGTGLGLATVYGIVRQNGGSIEVSSEPGKGTIFKIFLPRVDQEVDAAPAAEREQLAGGQETVLLVEDEALVRRLAKRSLQDQGYKVLEAESGGTALVIAEKYEDTISLLLTDVVMPSMNGRELLDKLLQSRPDIKALFTSGYTRDIIAHHGVLDESTNFIQKPFTFQSLALKVRSVLDS